MSTTIGIKPVVHRNGSQQEQFLEELANEEKLEASLKLFTFSAPLKPIKERESGEYSTTIVIWTGSK